MRFRQSFRGHGRITDRRNRCTGLIGFFLGVCCGVSERHSLFPAIAAYGIDQIDDLIDFFRGKAFFVELGAKILLHLGFRGTEIVIICGNRIVACAGCIINDVVGHLVQGIAIIGQQIVHSILCVLKRVEISLRCSKITLHPGSQIPLCSRKAHQRGINVLVFIGAQGSQKCIKAAVQ